MIRRPIDDISEADLVALVDNGVAEGRSLEFKRQIPGGSDADVKELLADITSLANAQDGDIVFGLEDSDGVASNLIGLESDSVDTAILRLENILRDGVEPRLTGTRFRWIDLANERGALVTRVPASVAAPHRIRFKNSGRFYNRNSRGKYEMDTHELREAFTAAGQMPVKLRELHNVAVGTAKGVALPFRLHDAPSAVISVVPLSFLRNLLDLPITPENIPIPVGASSISYLHTLEGIAIRTPLDEDDKVRSYTLTHRSGRVDAAWTIGGVRPSNGEMRKIIWPKSFREGVVDMARAATTRLRQLGVEGPWVLFASVFGLNGFMIFLDQFYGSDPAWRSEASLPEIIADDLSEDALKPILDAFPLLFGIPPAEFTYPT